MPRPKGPHLGKNRLNLEFNDGVIDALSKLVTWMMADSRSEVIRRCLFFVLRLSTEISKGDSIIVRKSDGSEKEIFLL